MKGISKKSCRDFLEPLLAPNSDSGLFLLPELQYIVRTAIRIVGHRRLLVLCLYARGNTPGGRPELTYTMFQASDSFITYDHRPASKGKWRTAMLENLEPDYYFTKNGCAFYSRPDEERVLRFCKPYVPDTSLNDGFWAMYKMQQQLRDKETLRRRKNRERKNRSKMSGLRPLPRDMESWLQRDVLPAYFFYDYRKGKKPVRGLCSACGETVELPSVRHNAKGVCPYCGRELTMKSNGKRGRIWDRTTASVVQRIDDNNLIIRISKAYLTWPKTGPYKMDCYEETRVFVKCLSSGKAESEAYHHSGDYEYYTLNASTVDDAVYDRLFDELGKLEETLGVRMGNSPTITVGWFTADELKKTTHPIPLLSLDKTKQAEELCSFMGDQPAMLMLKLDGLTIKVTYESGIIMEAATRGDGNEGEVVTHNVRGISGIPFQIPHKGRLVVTGEAFIRPSDFAALQDTLVDSSGQPYKNGRNLAAGSVRLLSSEYCRDRRVTFMPFNVLEGFDELPTKSAKLKELPGLGFQPCKHFISKRRLSVQETEGAIQQLRQYAQDNDIPIDGIVATYNDAAYARSCGRTERYYKDGLAFKFEDELYETKVNCIEWNPSRTGEIAPVAILHPVVIDGRTISRASLHNLSFIEGLELMPGNRVLISTRNQIIPHVEENLDRGGFDMDKLVMHRCPCCGSPTRIHETRNTVDGVERITKTLFCDNPDCATRRLRQFVHFAGKKAMDIEGLSEATLEKLIGWGLLHDRMDIYELDKHKDEIVQMDGFGEKSYQNLWDAIQRSRTTTFERYLIAMDIPMIGNTASRALAKQFHSSLDEFEDAVVCNFDFTQLPDFGETLHQNIHQWFQSEGNWYFWAELRNHVTIAAPAVQESASPDNPFVGKTIVVTGKVEPYTRDGINAKIESLGAHAGSSVSKKTDYLVCGENAGSKLEKARELGVTVLTPAQFFQMAGE